MIFKAKALNHARCAFARCMNAADKIYEDEHWRILACSQAHADIVREEINKVPPEYHGTIFREGKLPSGCTIPVEESAGLEYL